MKPLSCMWPWSQATEQLSRCDCGFHKYCKLQKSKCWVCEQFYSKHRITHIHINSDPCRQVIPQLRLCRWLLADVLFPVYLGGAASRIRKSLWFCKHIFRSYWWIWTKLTKKKLTPKETQYIYTESMAAEKPFTIHKLDFFTPVLLVVELVEVVIVLFVN